LNARSADVDDDGRSEDARAVRDSGYALAEVHDVIDHALPHP
jgi:hypothetical protein